MAKQAVGIGSSANDGTGDTLRAGADKINDNFLELYAKLGSNLSNPLFIAILGRHQNFDWSW